MRIRGGVPKRFIISSAADATSRSGSKGENSARVYAGEGGWGSDKNVLQREWVRERERERERLKESKTGEKQ